MRLTTKGRMAVTAMVDLALRNDDTPVPLAALSVRHHISMSYLEQLFSGLRKHRLVRSTRGPGGGYTLARDGAQISIADIILAVEESPAAADAANAPLGISDGLEGSFWNDINSRILAMLATVSLGSIAGEQKQLGFTAVEPQRRRRAPAFAPLPSRLPARGPNSVFALASHPL